MMTVLTSVGFALPPQVRVLDVSRDLLPVADLIELCFNQTLDADGRRYLRQMRAAGRSAHFLRWAAQVTEQFALPMSGFVWQESGRIVGNVSLIPYFSWRRRVLMIANVAVDPTWRGRGIARALTQAALQAVTRHKAEGWLQVRDDNPAALHLYQSLGFTEQARRTTWYSQPGWLTGRSPQTGLTVVGRRRRDWQQQRAALLQAYPLDLWWHFPIQLNWLQPGLPGLWHSLWNGVLLRHWSAVQADGSWAGTLTLQPSYTYADPLWAAVDPAGGNAALSALLDYALTRYGHHRPLSLDYPHGEGNDVLRALGFRLQHTLLWMRAAV
ncbi:MAG: hypothetical protein OHK0052_21300 [Anaerolineales bacterium]